MHFINRYKCPDCGHKWSEDGEHIVACDCPECDQEDIEPYVSDEVCDESR